MHTLKLPRKFYDDHMDRCSDYHIDQHLVEVKLNKSHVIIECDDLALDEIESDADYYSCQDNQSMEGYQGLIKSAKATLNIIKAYRQSL